MRDYDPTTGRYLQADPLGLVDGASVYGYALGNPLRWTDPTGQSVALAAGACTGPQFAICAAIAVGAIVITYVIISICEAAWEWWVYSKPGGGDGEGWRDSGDPPPSGHNQDPGGDGGGGGLLAALAALTVLDGANGIRVNEVDGNTVSITVEGQNGPIEILGEIGFNGSELNFENVHIQGSGPGTSSISELKEIGQNIGQAVGASTVTVTGAPRTSGANPGKTPTVTIRIK